MQPERIEQPDHHGRAFNAINPQTAHQHLLATVDAQRQDASVLLRSVPPLDSRMPSSHPVPCKICSAPSIAFDRVDFNKYCSVDNYYEFGYSGVVVDYVRCTECGFLFTTLCDDWSPDQFRDLIYNDDYIKVDGEYVETRPLRTAAVIAEWFRGAEDAHILDYGSGAGVFARRMRELGYPNIAKYDPFSSPSRPRGRFDVITCFEVIEHAPDPRGAFADMLSFLKPDGCILLSQTLQPDNILSARGSWWYLAPRNGHVSTFTEEALEHLGRENGLVFYRGETVYGFAGPSAGRPAQIALASIGPSFSTLRLFAPATMPDATIAFPAGGPVLWHRTESLGWRRFRWTGTHRRTQWRAQWSPVQRLRIHIPIVQEAEPDFAMKCTLSLNGTEQKVNLIRGDIAAEFDVSGITRGDIELYTPEPIRMPIAERRSVGVAIAACPC